VTDHEVVHRSEGVIVTDTTQQNAHRAASKVAEKTRVRGGPFRFFVSATNPLNEAITATSVAGSRVMGVAHPYSGSNSWHRISPEPGSTGVWAYRSDRPEPAIFRHEPADRLRAAPGSALDVTVHQKIDAYFSGIGVYRPLKVGEQEIHSGGYAQTWWGSRGVLDDRGGVCRRWLNMGELESGSRAPVHRLLFSRGSETTDTYSVGAVKRWDERGVGIFPKIDGDFCVERRLHLMGFKGIGLLDERWGQVISDEGVGVRAPTTGLLLRGRSRYWSDTGRPYTRWLDVDGNEETVFPAGATTGRIVRVPDGGDLQEFGLNRSVSVGLSERHIVGEDYVVRSWDRHTFEMSKNRIRLFNGGGEFRINSSTEESEWSHKSGSYILFKSGGTLDMFAPNAVRLLGANGEILSFDSGTGQLSLNSDPVIGGATGTINSRTYVREVDSSSVVVSGSENKEIVGGYKKSVGGSSGHNAVGDYALSVGGNGALIFGQKFSATYGLGKSETIGLGDDEKVLTAGNYSRSILAGNFEMMTKAGSLTFANLLANLELSVAGGAQLGNNLSSLAINPVGMTTLDAILLTLGKGGGQVLTNLTAPIIDTVTGAPHIGVPTIMAG